MLHRHSKLSFLTAVSVLALLTACDPGPGMLPPEEGGEPPEQQPETLELEEIESALADGQRQPLTFLVQATKPQPEKATRSLEEARDAIENAAELEPLREALAAGGWDSEQRVQMVYFAGTHHSGAPEDSIRHRQQQIHDELSAELEKFRRALSEAEKREGVRVDRDALHEAGVLTSLHTEVIR